MVDERIDILLSEKPLDQDACLSFVRNEEAGGINIFIGTVRGSTKNKKVTGLTFEAYEAMALSELKKIATRAFQEWPVIRMSIHHRTGALEVGEAAVVIAVSAAHRDAAFAVCRFCIDELKKTVPIWKKEHFDDGDVWVSAHP